MGKYIVVGRVEPVEREETSLDRARKRYLDNTKPFRLSLKSWERLKEKSESEGVPMTELIEEALDKYFEEEG